MSKDEIWMGRAEVRPLEGASPELAGATYAAAVILAYASGRDAFEAVFGEILADEHLELIELEEIGPIREVWDLDDQFLYALDTAESGDPSVTVWSTDEPADAEDADTATVRAAAASGAAVQFRLIAGNNYFFGFPVDVSEDWALIHIISREVVALNGYLAVRFDCVIDAEVMEDSDTFMLRAMECRGERPLNPGLPLDNHTSLLATLSERYPIVALLDATMPGGVAVGRITRLAADKVTLRGVTTGGKWTSSKQHLYKNIEAIRFGHAYEAALASVLS